MKLIWNIQKKKIIDNINNFFEYSVVKKLKLMSFDDENKIFLKKDVSSLNVTNNKFQNKINNVKNEKIKKSLNDLIKVFKNK